MTNTVSTTTTPAPSDEDSAIEAFYADLASYELKPLWTQKGLLPREPVPAAVAHLWRWTELRALAARAGELIGISRGGDRRVLSLTNPGLGGLPFATPTLWGALQYLGPKEFAPGHRHTPGAVRLVLEGSGVWTTVNGDACDMTEGDLVLTPGMTWHDHNSSSDGPMLWFDGLDLPLVRHLDAVFFEEYPGDAMQPVQGRNASVARFGGPGVLPVDRPDGSSYSPLLIYRRDDYARVLDTLVAESERGYDEIEFVDPVTGRPALPTLGCSMLRIRAGVRAGVTREVASNVVVVMRGSGHSIIGGVRFDWREHDMFVVPTWQPVEHVADAESDLFFLSDAPVVRSLGLYRRESLAEPQSVTRVFGA